MPKPLDPRSHWDIDLVEGVGRRLIHRYRSIGYCTDAERHRIYAMIAFIEDWQAERQSQNLDVQAALSALRSRAERAEAAIERVRELHRQSRFSNECIECAPGGTYYWPCPTVEALDGAE